MQLPEGRESVLDLKHVLTRLEDNFVREHAGHFSILFIAVEVSTKAQGFES